MLPVECNSLSLSPCLSQIYLKITTLCTMYKFSTQLNPDGVLSLNFSTYSLSTGISQSYIRFHEMHEILNTIINNLDFFFQKEKEINWNKRTTKKLFKNFFLSPNDWKKKVHNEFVRSYIVWKYFWCFHFGKKKKKKTKGVYINLEQDQESVCCQQHLIGSRGTCCEC